LRTPISQPSIFFYFIGYYITRVIYSATRSTWSGAFKMRGLKKQKAWYRAICLRSIPPVSIKCMARLNLHRTIQMSNTITLHI